MRNFSPRFVGVTKHLFLLSLIFLTSFNVFGQKTVTGTVKDNTRQTGLAGATVAVRGTNVATSTDVNGAFSIAVPAVVSRRLSVAARSAAVESVASVPTAGPGYCVTAELDQSPGEPWLDLAR